MGTEVHVVVIGDAGLLDAAQARVEQLEQRWSRFLPASELSGLNDAAGQAVRVSADTITLVRACATAWAATEGRFDPTLRRFMVALGYDRDFAAVAATSAHCSALPSGPTPHGMGGVVIDGRAGTVRVPFGLGLDAGGIGKGLAADMVVAELMSLGADGAMVNVGGDLAARGTPPDGDAAWTVAVEDPFDSHSTLCRVAVVQGGLATSSILGRRWSVNGVEVHHVLDPHTGRPTSGRLVAATVVAGEAWWAEALTKSLLVGGPTVPLPAASALVVDTDGQLQVLGDGEDIFLGTVPVRVS